MFEFEFIFIIEDYFETTRNVKGIVSNITILDTAGQETYQSLLSGVLLTIHSQH